MANSQDILIGKKARRAFIALYMYTLFLFVFNKSQHDLTDQSRRFKKFNKIRLGSKLLLSLIYGSGWNWCIPGFDENKTQHWALF